MRKVGKIPTRGQLWYSRGFRLINVQTGQPLDVGGDTWIYMDGRLLLDDNGLIRGALVIKTTGKNGEIRNGDKLSVDKKISDSDSQQWTIRMMRRQ